MSDDKVTQAPVNGSTVAKPQLGTADTNKTEPGKTEPGKTEPGKTEPGKTEPGKTEPGKTEPGKTEPGKTEQNKAEEKLAIAREAHATAISSIRDDVLQLIESKDAAERKRANPDLAKLKAIKAEQEALEQRGELPKWIDFKTKERIVKANAPLLAALTAVKRSYILARDDEKAMAVDAELAELLKGTVILRTTGGRLAGRGAADAISPNPAAVEAFKQGARLVGKRDNLPMSVHIDKVEGVNLAGSMNLDGRVYAIVGRIDGNRVTLSTVKRNGGSFAQNAVGEMRGNAYVLTFTGVSFKNKPVSGGGSLTVRP
jgi:hypothetical protein